MQTKSITFEKTDVVRQSIKHEEDTHKKVYLTYKEAKNFADLGKKVWVEDFDKMRQRYFVYIDKQTLMDNCL